MTLRTVSLGEAKSANNSSWVLRVLVLTLTAIGSPVASAGEVPAPAELLHVLRSVDEVYRSGLSVYGSKEDLQLSLSNGGVKISMHFAMTSSRHMVAIAEESPTIGVLPAAVLKSAGDFGNVYCKRFTTQDEHGAAELSATAGPADFGKSLIAVSDNDLSWLLEIYGRRDSTLEQPIVQIPWLCGRGFSSYIERITSIKAIANDALLVNAVGHGIAGGSGRWELSLDRKAAYLVRHASFFSGHLETPDYGISNSDSVEAEDRVVPRTAIWTEGRLGMPMTASFTIEKVSAVPDQHVIDDVMRHITGPFVGTTTVLDYRGEGDPVASFFRRGQRYIAYPQTTRPSNPDQ